MISNNQMNTVDSLNGHLWSLPFFTFIELSTETDITLRDGTLASVSKAALESPRES